jgi:hypothetical protein
MTLSSVLKRGASRHLIARSSTRSATSTPPLLRRGLASTCCSRAQAQLPRSVSPPKPQSHVEPHAASAAASAEDPSEADLSHLSSESLTPGTTNTGDWPGELFLGGANSRGGMNREMREVLRAVGDKEGGEHWGEASMMGGEGYHVVQDLHGLSVKEILGEGREGGVRDEKKMRHFTGACSDFHVDRC